ncbi:MAG TPA: MaoC/PaaZ C-terminal domain-containing protein [Dehalococcoidia bacterium]|nr:MaoC/PaaZ C-terminal domain-containing protein [Dehalococcoidia bacterium]
MTLTRSVRDFTQIEVGEALTPLAKPVTVQMMMAYGAATWDFIRLHYDADYVRSLGFPAPFVDGQMFGGILAQAVQDWAGPGAFLRRLTFRNRVMTYPGDTITCRGVVTDKIEQDGQRLVACDLWVENQKGERVVHPAGALIRFP